MVRSTSCQRSSDSASGRRMDRPALLIKMSTPPRRCSTSTTSASTASRSDRSQEIAVASPPLAVMRPTSSSSRSWRRATATTVAPWRANCSAALSPMPDEAPVSRTRLPARSILVAPGRGSRRGVSGGRMVARAICSASRRSGFLLTSRESRWRRRRTEIDVSAKRSRNSARWRRSRRRAPARSSAGTRSNPAAVSPGTRRGLRRPRRSCTPTGWPHRQTAAVPPARRRAG